ncbi:DNA damage-inducible protein 1 [Apiospora hydei]|uniref:DNA damage-inducible protein 1 n=1 Tax=Apiospora hydei TaxID=1337664 RepID=A0ABR1VX48_9PEZI
MDPLSAVSLAGTVVAFVDFSLKLVYRATEMYSSDSGSYSEETSLETVYTTLSEFSVSLSTVVGDATATGGGIRALAQSGENDCAAMLRILGKLKEARKFEPEDSPIERRAKGFCAALKAIFKDPQLKSIEARLQRTQTALTLGLCAISSRYMPSTYHEQHLRSYQDLKNASNDYQTRHGNQLAEIRSILGRIQQRQTATKTPLTAGNFHHADVLSLEKDMSRLSVATRDVAYQQEILKGLSFGSLHYRRHSILDAHEQTFHWALREEGRQVESQERLENWFASGTSAGTFWVSGKPGSGKSTFMKYVVNSDQAIQKLKSWAQGHDVVVASHFLWCRGSPMQRSHQGLLRTLLLDIFRQRPHLISQVFDRDADSSSGTDATDQIDWDIPQLRSTLESLTSGSAPGTKFCIFIDGLDECDGDHVELGQYLLKLSESPLVKLCVSSRPWNVFEDAFGRDLSTKLYMHELNGGDILRYTRSRLFKHPRWELLLVRQADACSLVDEITKRSEGVFLWVFLVTGMLREGLTNDDSFADLGERLSSFPSDLLDFFRNIIESVEPIYQERMAGCLQLAQAAIKPLETLIYYFHDVQYDNHVHAPHQYSPLGLLERSYTDTLKQHTVRRINAYCRGLLEFRDGKVEFLHRTVGDFLDTAEMIQVLAEKSRAEFDPLVSILDCIASLLETQRREYRLFTKNLKMAMTYASLVEKRNDESSVIAHLCLDRISGYLPLQTSSTFAKPDFIKLAIETYLLSYLDISLQRDPAYCDCLHPDVINISLDLPASSMKERLLDMVFKRWQSRDAVGALPLSWVDKSCTNFLSRQLLENPRVYRRFLEHGADPNAVMSADSAAQFQHATAWTEFLEAAFVFDFERPDQQTYLEILDLLIDHGAQVSGTSMQNRVYSLFATEWQDGPLDSMRSRNDRGAVCEADNEAVGGPNSSRRKFIADVLMRLIRKADRDMSRFWPAIDGFLGTELLQTMKAGYFTAVDGREQLMSAVKASRPRSTSPGAVLARKRQRQLHTSNDTSAGQQGHPPTASPGPNYCVISDSEDDQGRKPTVACTGSGTVDDPVSIGDDSD